MWFDDANIQIVGYDSNDLDLFSKMQLNEIATKFNESMRHKNIIKRQQKEINELNIKLLEEKLKNMKNEFNKIGDK